MALGPESDLRVMKRIKERRKAEFCNASQGNRATLKPSGWVSVDEALPEIAGQPGHIPIPCFAWFGPNEEPLACIYAPTNKAWYRNGRPLSGVTHWMPIEPPR